MSGEAAKTAEGPEGGPNASPGSPYILALVTRDPKAVFGGVPVFVAADEKEQAEIAADLARVLRSDVARLANGVYVLTPVIR